MSDHSKLNHRIATAEGAHQAERHRRERVEQKLDKRDARIRELEQEVESLRGDAYVSSEAGLTLDILLMLPRLNSNALRKIADDCEKLIAARMEDGVFE